MRLTTLQTHLIRILSSYQDLISFQDGRVPCNLCCASAYSQICFHSASDQACLWAFSATRPEVLDGGFKGRIVAHRWGKDMAGMNSKVGFFKQIIPWRSLIKNTHQKKSSHLRIFLYSDILNFTYSVQKPTEPLVIFLYSRYSYNRVFLYREFTVQYILLLKIATPNWAAKVPICFTCDFLASLAFPLSCLCETASSTISP